MQDKWATAPLPARASGLLQGEKTATTVTMNGVQFHYDALEGQKTGSFLDQRENYFAAAHYAKGEALDVFCYQGGFALHLAPRCSQVTGVDSSRPALEVADRNATLNRDPRGVFQAGRVVDDGLRCHDHPCDHSFRALRGNSGLPTRRSYAVMYLARV